MHLVSPGLIALPENFPADEKQPVAVKPFYMDEAPVTNHQYVEFLNKDLARITVADGVVRGDEAIWLFLGEVKLGYEPIAYRDGKFHMAMAHHAACPVLRVTAYGAVAYARFYGKRLPSVAQWFQAVTAGEKPQEADRIAVFPDKNLPLPSPIMEYKPNGLGIGGLNANIGEWGLRSSEDAAEDDSVQIQYEILGGMPGESPERRGIDAPIHRYPWEAFERVGFRCVHEVSSQASRTANPRISLSQETQIRLKFCT
jgi:eukaryotic-like serine/threonine-protein kinase